MEATSIAAAVRRRVRATLADAVAADLRSLAALRIALALIVLADLASRVKYLFIHYTDHGVLPREVLISQSSEWRWSLFLINGELVVQALLFGVAAAAALAMLVGYRTRLATVLTWVLVVSLHWRNPLLLNAGDTLLRVLLFWCMFLPLGAAWSVDRALAAPAPKPATRFVSVATAALLLQIAFVYWFTAILKSDDQWRSDFTAIYYALSLDQFTTPAGAFVYQFPTLLKALTVGTIVLEAFGPFLLFCPFLAGRIKLGAAAAFMGLQVGILLTMGIGLFSWLSALCMVCFFPSWFWDTAVPKLRGLLPRVPDLVPRLRQAASRLAAGTPFPLPQRLIATGGAGQPAVAGIAAASAGAADALPAAPLGSAAPPPAPAPAAGGGRTGLRSSPLTNLLALALLLYVFVWNLTTVSDVELPESLEPLGTLLAVGQKWSMFSPRPTQSTAWYAVPATLRDGQRIDVLPVIVHNDLGMAREVSWEKPEDFSIIMPDESWRKYLNALVEEDNSEYRYHFARYVCREWNSRHPDPLEIESLEIVLVREPTLPDYERGEPTRRVVSERVCG